MDHVTAGSYGPITIHRPEKVTRRRTGCVEKLCSVVREKDSEQDGDSRIAVARNFYFALSLSHREFTTMEKTGTSWLMMGLAVCLMAARGGKLHSCLFWGPQIQ